VNVIDVYCRSGIAVVHQPGQVGHALRPRAQIAISHASHTSSVRMLVAARQPRIRRENASKNGRSQGR
jgi:hypothetical protein